MATVSGVPVAVVTDSTAYLPVGLADGRGIKVVPLEVRLGTLVGREGVDIDAAAVSAALADRHLVVQTSRPAPAEFAGIYRAALAGGATEVVSVHLSRELSGTWEAARLAAEEVGPERVRVVDSRATAMGLGYAVLAAADAAGQGADAEAVEAAAADVATRCHVFFCVDTLDRLRRGGRIGAAAALVGSALAVKPLLHVAQGRIVPLEKVRTTGGRPSGWWSLQSAPPVTAPPTSPCTTWGRRSGPRSWPSACGSGCRARPGSWCPRWER